MEEMEVEGVQSSSVPSTPSCAPSTPSSALSTPSKQYTRNQRRQFALEISFRGRQDGVSVGVKTARRDLGRERAARDI